MLRSHSGSLGIRLSGLLSLIGDETLGGDNCPAPQIVLPSLGEGQDCAAWHGGGLESRRRKQARRRSKGRFGICGDVQEGVPQVGGRNSMKAGVWCCPWYPAAVHRHVVFKSTKGTVGRHILTTPIAAFGSYLARIPAFRRTSRALPRPGAKVPNASTAGGSSSRRLGRAKRLRCIPGIRKGAPPSSRRSKHIGLRSTPSNQEPIRNSVQVGRR